MTEDLLAILLMLRVVARIIRLESSSAKRILFSSCCTHSPIAFLPLSYLSPPLSSVPIHLVLPSFLSWGSLPIIPSKWSWKRCKPSIIGLSWPETTLLEAN